MLHANVAVPAGDRTRLEQLCRYLLRPAVAQDLLACPRCGGRLRLIALVEDSQAISEILAGLARPAKPRDRGPPVPLVAHAILHDSPDR